MVEISYSYHHTSLNRRAEFLYELIGTRGVIHYDAVSHTFCLENDEGSQQFEFHHEKSFTGMYAEWARALETGGSELLATAEQGMRVVEIAREATNEAIANRPHGGPG